MLIALIIAIPSLICVAITIWARHTPINPAVPGQAPPPSSTLLGRLNQQILALESSLNIQLAGLVAGLATLFSIGAGLGYLIWGETKDALEFGSYVMPCIGAVAAGAAIYAKAYEKVAFAFSLICFLLGAQLFLACHPNNVFVWGMGVVGILTLLSVTLLYVFLSTPANGSLWIVGRDVLVVLGVITLAVWSGMFLMHNVECLKDVMSNRPCRHVWLVPTF